MPIRFRCPNPQCSVSVNARDELAGKPAKCPKCGTSFTVPGPTTEKPPAPAGGAVSSSDIETLWKDARRLSGEWNDPSQQQAEAIYTRLLAMVDERSSEYNVCAILRNRAMARQALKRYAAALEDLREELAIAKKRGDWMRVAECERITEETREWEREDALKASAGKGAKLETMQKHARRLSDTGPEADAGFDALVDDLTDPDPEIRLHAAKLLGERPAAIERLIRVHRGCLQSDPRRASLAGRVLGRRAAKGSSDMVPPQVARLLFGISISFVPCLCVHCGHTNIGIPAPQNGPMVPYYHQQDNRGAYAVPVLCDKCGKEYFVVWDRDPR
jgi:hypothetical protein